MKIHKSHKSKWPWPVYAEVARRLLWEFQKERAIHNARPLANPPPVKRRSR